MGIIGERQKKRKKKKRNSLNGGLSEKMTAKIGGRLWVKGRQKDKPTPLGCAHPFGLPTSNILPNSHVLITFSVLVGPSSRASMLYVAKLLYIVCFRLLFKCERPTAQRDET